MAPIWSIISAYTNKPKLRAQFRWYRFCKAIIFKIFEQSIFFSAYPNWELRNLGKPIILKVAEIHWQRDCYFRPILSVEITWNLAIFWIFRRKLDAPLLIDWVKFRLLTEKSLTNYRASKSHRKRLKCGTFFDQSLTLFCTWATFYWFSLN